MSKSKRLKSELVWNLCFCVYNFQIHKMFDILIKMSSPDITHNCLKSKQKVQISDTFLTKHVSENNTFLWISENLWNLNFSESKQVVKSILAWTSNTYCFFPNWKLRDRRFWSKKLLQKAKKNSRDKNILHLEILTVNGKSCIFKICQHKKNYKIK